MHVTFQNRTLLVVVVLFLILGVILANLIFYERESLTFPEKLAIEVLSYGQRAVGGALVFGRTVFSDLRDITALREENMMLREKLRFLETRVQDYEELKAENNRLRSYLFFEPRLPQDFLGARVIAYNPNTWLDTVTINRGSRAGVSLNMPVVGSKGLVGRVMGVTYSSAEVLLINSTRSAVGAIIQRSRDLGIIEGHPSDARRLIMKNLSWDTDIRAGDTVVTSGLGEIFPKGIRIGVIEEVYEDDLGLAKRAIVRPDIDFSRLEEVLVIREF